MLLLALFAIGFVVALAAAATLRRPRSRVILAGAGVLALAGYTIYVEGFAACPRRGECDKALGIILLAVLVAGWVTGAAASWPVRRCARERLGPK